MPPAITNLPCAQCDHTGVSIHDRFACGKCGCAILRLDGVYASRGWHFRFYSDGPVVVYMYNDAFPGSDKWMAKVKERLHGDGHDIESRRFQFGTYSLFNDNTLTADLSGPEDGGRIELAVAGQLHGSEIHAAVTRNWILQHPNGREEPSISTVSLNLQFHLIEFDDLERVA